MKKYPAIALLEFDDIPAGMTTADAMLKESPVAVIRAGTIGGAGFLTILAGTTAAVQEALREGLLLAGERLRDHAFLPDIHPALYDAVLEAHRNPPGGAIGVLTTSTVTANVLALERALKGTPVTLVEVRLGDPALAGQALGIVSGELRDVQAAMELALEVIAARAVSASHRIITAPHEAFLRQLGQTSDIFTAAAVELEGEKPATPVSQ